MSNAEGQGEPSMEEILASIRRIISEEDSPEDEAASNEGAKTAPEDEEPLELTEAIEDHETVVDLNAAKGELEEPEAESEPEPEPETEPEPEEEAEADEPVELVTGDVDSDEDQAEPEVEEPVSEEERREEIADNLVSSMTAAAATASLTQIIDKSGQDDRRNANMGASRTLEEVVRDAIMPELKVWLDRNLAPLVERIVRAEIKKMVRRAEDR